MAKYGTVAVVGAALGALGLMACGGSGDGTGGTGADGSGANKAGASGTGAAGTGANGMGANGTGAALPMVKPPVEQSTPVGLRAGNTTHGLDFQLHTATPSLDSGDIKSRFFGAGPTNIFRVLDDIDGRIEGINVRSKENEAACLSETPVAYSLTPWGNDVTFYAQCYESFGPSSFMQFGKKDGVTYIYTVSGAGPVAARITPIGTDGGADGGTDGGADGGTDGGVAAKYSVHAWIAIADGKKTGGSYGVIELDAHPTAQSFEMAVSGIGFGYCGAQLRANAETVYVTGSTDMGSTCNEVGTTCVAASDIATVATCEPPLSTFALTPLGRLATANATGSIGASKYPGDAENVVNLDGSETDSTAFGPTSPTVGVGSFGAVSEKADAGSGKSDSK